MKKQITIGMMTVMIVLGTTTSFGKTNNSQPRHEQPRMEVRVNKPQVGPQHQMEPRHEMNHHHGVRPHRHEFGRHHKKCRVCHLTKHQIRQTTKQQPITWRNTCQQPVRE